MFFLRAVKFWIVLSALASIAGWTLSALGMLNKTGYALFAAAAVVLIFLFRKSLVPSPAAGTLKKLRHRLRYFLPASFAILALLVFVSGMLYAPSDHTGLSYRLPRVLQWLQHGRWFWIHTPNYRQNDRACGIEWLSAPLLLFLKSDRVLFLLNFIPFLLLPGLIFSVWTRLGVRPRVAWSWMWLVPTGYCFLIQAGGIANDAFPTVYALAMLDFALRAHEKLRAQSLNPRSSTLDSGNLEFGTWNLELGFSVLSAALLVGAKASNLPLGLPWVLLIVPLLPRVLRIPRTALALAFVLLIALIVSFIPTALLNIHYVHDWSGLSIEKTGLNMKNPVGGVVGNSLELTLNNFAPTFFPMAGWWNQHAPALFPHALIRMMDANFEPGYLALGEMPTEDSAGIGFGISMLVAISVLAALWCRRREFGNSKPKTRNPKPTGFLPPLLLRAVLIAPWISLLAYTMKSGMVTPGRLISPYYPLLFPALLVGASQSQIVRRCWWRALAMAVVALALAALIVMPSRPLWPAKTILSKAVAAHPNQPQLKRAQKVYDVYAQRSDPLAGLRQSLPPDLKTIGFMGTDDDLDISLWKPYGSRRVEPFLFEDSPEKIRQLGIEYAVISGLNLDTKKTTIENYLQQTGAELLATTNATMTVSQGPEPWYLIRFR